MARLGEAVFAVAGGVGGWLVVGGYALTLAVLPQAPCAPGDDAPWSGTAVFGVVAALAGVLAGAGLRERAALRWIALAVAPLVVFDAVWIAPTLAATSFAGERALCAASTLAPSTWERAWPPVQLAALAVAAWQAWRYWRPAPSPPAAPGA